MRYNILKQRRHQKSVQVKALKESRRRKLWLKQKHRKLNGRSKRQRLFDETVKNAHLLHAPEEFSINRHPDDVFKFIEELKKVKTKTSIKNVHISLKNCKYISNGSIALMISAIEELKESGIKVSGNYPENADAKRTLEKSGFFNYVIGNVSDENKLTINTIVHQGLNIVDPEVVAPLVTQAMKTVWGARFRNQRVQSLLIELMANTVNHAFLSHKNRRWYLSISHDEVKRVASFTFIDNGMGINKTLSIKFIDKIKTLFLSSNIEIIKAAFDGKFGSRTKERKRGRGLPSIKKSFEENYISRLTVVTNDVYLDFQTEKGQKLKYEFEGTCYHWELNLNCIKWDLL